MFDIILLGFHSPGHNLSKGRARVIGSFPTICPILIVLVTVKFTLTSETVQQSKALAQKQMHCKCDASVHTEK